MTSQQSEPARDLRTMKPVNTPAWSWGGTREPQPLVEELLRVGGSWERESPFPLRV